MQTGQRRWAYPLTRCQEDMEFEQAAWLTKAGQQAFRPQLAPTSFRLCATGPPAGRSRPESALDQHRGTSRRPSLGVILVRPGTSLGTFQLKELTAGHGTTNVGGMSRRNVKSLPGWKQFFDHSTLSYYWVNTHDHTSQWHHPSETLKQATAEWDGQKAEVKLRKDKAGIVIGSADHWLSNYHSERPEMQGPDSLCTKQAVLAMMHRWSLKWDKINEAFRGMDVKANGEVNRSQLRTALIRFNVSYNDALLENVWMFLDPADTGVVKISALTDFIFENEPLRHKRVSIASKVLQDHGKGAQSQEHIQLMNAAQEKNQFARGLIKSMKALQDALMVGDHSSKMNRFALTSILARVSLLPKNTDLVGEFDDFLSEMYGGAYTKGDINVENIRAFARKHSFKPVGGVLKQLKNSVVWSPVDGGSKRDQIDLLPPDHRPSVQLIRDKLFSKYQNPSSAFRYLDKEKKGVITMVQFRKVSFRTLLININIQTLYVRFHR